jgi:pumilio RNA-binding family
MCDTYANYMCQQLFPATIQPQRIRLLVALAPHFTAVARDRRGTHSLQALLIRIDSDEERDILRLSVSGKTTLLALDCHATHVLQQVLTSLGVFHVSTVMSEIVASLPLLAVDQFGLGVVKRAIALAESSGSVIQLGNRIDESLFQLVEDAFGNYAVQHAIENWSRVLGSAGSVIAKRMANRLAERIVALSSHKFASNVAEAIIRVGDSQLKLNVVKAFAQNPEVIASLMKSPFPVFVVTTALKFCVDPNLSQIVLGFIASNLKGIHPSMVANPDVKNRPKWEKLIRSIEWGPPTSTSDKR